MKPEIYKTLVCSTSHVSQVVGEILNMRNKALSLGSFDWRTLTLNHDIVGEKFYDMLTNRGWVFDANLAGRFDELLRETQTVSGTHDPRDGWRFKVPPSDEDETKDFYLEYFDMSIGEEEIRDHTGELFVFDDLLAVLRHAFELGCAYVQFDPDGPAVPGLKTYEW